MNKHLLKILLLTLALTTGCGDKHNHDHKGHDHKEPAKHEHKPPNGGTPVELGNEEYHLEFLLDAPSGKLVAYVLDGELEKYIRCAMESFAVQAEVSGKTETLQFLPVANSATGEKVGDTSQFEAQADWLKTTPVFNAVLKVITVGSKTYTNISFNFPKGSDESAKK